MKRPLVFLSLLLMFAASFVHAEEDAVLKQSKELQEKSSQVLEEMGKAVDDGDIAKAKAAGSIFSHTVLELDQMAGALRLQEQFDEVEKLENKLREDTLKHAEHLKQVREIVPPQDKAGIDRAIAISLQK